MSRIPAETLFVDDRTALYLNRLILRTGDVLLTRGAAKVSGCIARLSAGPFSHSAIVVNSALLFESDDIGVGYTSLAADRIEGGGEAMRLLTALIGVRAAVVLRHPGLAELDKQDLEEDLIVVLYPFLGLEYPKWADLASAFPGGPTVGFPGKLLLKLRDWHEGQTLWNPGPFCSQLVSGALTSILPKPYQLFKRERAHNTVSPNTLLKSNLRPVKDGVVLANPDASIDLEFLERFRRSVPTPSRDASTGAMVRSKAIATMNVETANRIFAEQRQALRDIRDALESRKG